MKGSMYGFDTEDDSSGNIYWINFFDGTSHTSFKTRLEAIKFLNKSKGKFWATNLEYDLCNIFGDDLSVVQWNYGKTKLIWARYRSVYFFDSLNQTVPPLSVESMGKILGYPKLPFDPKNLKYCQTDTEITFFFIERLQKFYDDLNQKIKATVASIALDYWRKGGYFPLKCNGTRTSEIPKLDLEKFRQSYYGGRTEAFHLGEVKGDIQYVDINSMYPYAMLGVFPNPSLYIRGVDLDAFGVTYADVSCNMDIPVLPYRADSGRLVFPNGNFSGCWTNEELRYFTSKGGKIIKAKDGYFFPLECTPFENYVLDLYTKRKNCKDEWGKIVYKNLLNNLYGKFGQGNEKVVVMGYDKFIADKRYNPLSGRKLGNMVIFELDGEYPYQTNFIWPAYITSKSRIYLHQLLTQVKSNEKNRLLYCDTDSVIFKGTIKGLKISNELGSFKHEGTFKSFNAKGAKVYKYRKMDDESIVKCKGVPSREMSNFFENNTATYKKPLKMREALRRDLRPNLWINQTKVVVEEYSKGKVLKNGDIIPLTINE